MGSEFISFFIPIIPMYLFWCGSKIYKNRSEILRNKVVIFNMVVAMCFFASIFIAPNVKAGLAFHGLFLLIYLIVTIPIIKLVEYVVLKRKSVGV
jgi:hypothetical protein